MAKRDEISSTERLLNLIRTKGEDTAADPQPPAEPIGNRKHGKIAGRIRSIGQNTLGVDFGQHNLRLAVVSQTADKKPVLIQQGSFPYDKDLSVHSPRFPTFLKSILDDFCGSDRRVNIWCAIPSSNVDTRFFRIPKVPKKQLATTVFWSHKKESNIDEKETVFDFEILGDTVEDGRPRTNVLTYTAPKADVESLKKIFSKAGYSLAGMSIAPFAVQNLFRTGWTDAEGKTVCTLYIGADSSRIAVYADKNLVLSREIKSGVQSMIEAVAEDMERTHPELAMTFDESRDFGLVTDDENFSSPFTDTAERLLEGFISGDIAVADDDVRKAGQPADVFHLITPALDRVVRQVERTLDHYYLNFDRERVKKVYLSGPICSHKRLILYISRQLGIDVEYMDPFMTGLPAAVTTISPETLLERGKFVVAIGMAMARNSHTPNFTYTYKDRVQSAKVLRLNRTIFGLSLLLMLTCITYFAWQTNLLDQKEAMAAAMQRQLDSYVPKVDQKMVLNLTVESFSERQSVDAFADRYRGMAVISEIVNQTPETIRLSGMSIDLGRVEGDAPSTDKDALAQRGKTVLLDGIVTGDRLTFESVLAGYMVKLENSRILGRPEILEQQPQVIDGEPILRFTARVDII